MPGIKKLESIYENKGLMDAKKYLEGNITITEKLDAHRFSFQVDDQRKIHFYKKNDNREISLVDRIISDLYEKAINHIESLPKSILNNVPKNIRFGFSYFPNEKPLRIKYSQLPKNNLVLTDVSLRSEKGKVKKVYEDQNYLNNWADTLNVSRPPIIFQGELSEDQKQFIMKMVKRNESTNAFFAQHIEGLFENTFSKNAIIEGIVFKNKNGLTQLRDPSYKIFYGASIPEVNRDFYDLTIIQIQEFLKDFEFKIPKSQKSLDEKYVEIVSDAYNHFIDAKLIDESFNAEFLRPNIVGAHGEMGRKFIRNSETLKRINNSSLNEELYKVFLISLRKKKSAHGLLNQGLVDNFNKIVENIQELCNNNIPSFNQLNKIYEEGNIDIEKQQPNYIKIVSSLQKAFTKEIQHKETKKLQEGICIIDKFDFLTKEHLDIIHSLTNENVILVNLSKKKVKMSNEIFQLNDQDINQILKVTKNENSNIKEIIHCPYSSLEKIFYQVRKIKYEPITFYVNKKSISNYSLQYNTIKYVLGDRLKISKDFDIQTFTDESKRTIFRSIEDNDYQKFKDNTPEFIKNFWEIYKSRYNIWREK